HLRAIRCAALTRENPQGLLELTDFAVRAQDLDQRLKLKPGTSSELTWLAHFMQRYGDQRDILAATLFSHPERYKSVSDAAFTRVLPCRFLETPGELIAGGCVKQGIVWIRAQVFDALESRQQALFLLHESMHLDQPHLEHSKIAALITGLSLILDQSKTQSEGIFENLSAVELEQVRDVFIILGGHGIILPGGAVLLDGSTVSGSGFAGVGTRLQGRIELDPGAALLDAEITGFDSVRLRAGAAVFSSKLTASPSQEQILIASNDNPNLKSTQIVKPSLLLDGDAKIERSQLMGFLALELHTGSLLSDVNLAVPQGANTLSVELLADASLSRVSHGFVQGRPEPLTVASGKMRRYRYPTWTLGLQQDAHGQGLCDKPGQSAVVRASDPEYVSWNQVREYGCL
ncbi:hypothetical protein WDW37_13265, partial [Bdellovibrionota bacterium FG-1]